MKAARPYPKIIITPKGEAALTGGHPWVYEGEVTAVDGAAEDGGLVDVVSRRGSWLGCGFYNSRSKIRVRLVSRNANDDFSDAFWERRIRYAWEYRKTVMGETDSRCCRVIFGEADLFPGLTVDRFESVLVTQTLSLGMERIKSRLFPLLAKVLREDGQDIRASTSATTWPSASWRAWRRARAGIPCPVRRRRRRQRWTSWKRHPLHRGF